MDVCKNKLVKFMMWWYWRVLIARIEEKNSKNHQISIFDFQCVSMNIEGWLKDFTPHLVYSQIWLNLPRDDPHFFYTFLLDDHHSDYIKKFLNKDSVVGTRLGALISALPLERLYLKAKECRKEKEQRTSVVVFENRDYAP